MTSQARWAVVSVPANIAEGQGRRGAKEFAHHLSIAMGPLCGVETHLLIAHELEHLDEAARETLIAQTAEVSRLVYGLSHSLREA